jgi:polyhydroxybutyrate depolymerase
MIRKNSIQNRRLFTILMLAGLFFAGLTFTTLVRPAQAEAATTKRVLPSGRPYYYYKPAVLNSPAPIVVMMNGLYLTPGQAEQTTGFDALATKYKFVIVYAQGNGGSWNAGNCCNNNKSDDVGYLDQIVIDVSKNVFPIYAKRQYLAGFSNGGMMAYRAACVESTRWAAIGVMSGTSESPCSPQQPFSVVDIQGLADTTVPFNGGYSAYLKMNLTSANLMQPYLNKYFKCSAQMTSASLYGATVRDSTGCPPGIGLETLTLSNVGHAWSTSANGYDASLAMWTYFWRHPKP